MKKFLFVLILVSCNKGKNIEYLDKHYNYQEFDNQSLDIICNNNFNIYVHKTNETSKYNLEVNDVLTFSKDGSILKNHQNIGKWYRNKRVEFYNYQKKFFFYIQDQNTIILLSEYVYKNNDSVYFERIILKDSKRYEEIPLSDEIDL